MRIDNRVIHAPTGLLSLESNNSEIKTFLLFFLPRTPEPHQWHPRTSRTPFYERLLGTHCENKQLHALWSPCARPSLLNLFRLKVAFFVKGICSVCTCEHLCRVSQGQRKPTGFFSLSLSSDRLLLFRQCGLTPLQQREIFKPSS